MSLGRILKWSAVGLAAAFVTIQILPFGRSHTNPAAHAEPRWDSSRTAELAAVACYDCHSNRTEWPWYSHVAPISWLVERDVYAGRDELNFSEPQELRRKLEEKARKEREKALERASEGKKPEDEKLPELLEVVLEGEMPPWYYAIAHGDSQLSDAERRELARGLAETFDLEYEG
jgi:mono/diheme cytochrome c family protein